MKYCDAENRHAAQEPLFKQIAGVGVEMHSAKVVNTIPEEPELFVGHGYVDSLGNRHTILSNSIADLPAGNWRASISRIMKTDSIATHAPRIHSLPTPSASDGCLSSATGTVMTSITSSTTSARCCCRQSRTRISLVEAWSSICGKPKRVRMFMTGITVPRSVMTPSRYRDGLAREDILRYGMISLMR